MCWACAATVAQAAGGHHGVDDAAILEPGACEVEGWLTRGSRGQRLSHAGTGCRVGPVELGAAVERERDPTARATAYGLQVKWATEVANGLNVGVSAAPAWQSHARPRYQGTTLAALLSWSPREDIALHANWGRDLVRGGASENRSGLAFDWIPTPGWTLMAERYAESAAHYVRAGARWAATEKLTLDLSRSRLLHGPGASHWTLGATWAFER
jgi:hypothetical protein